MPGGFRLAIAVHFHPPPALKKACRNQFGNAALSLTRI